MKNKKRQVKFTVLGTKEEYDKLFDEIENLPDHLAPEEIVSEIQKRISLAVIWGMPLERKFMETFPMHRIRVQKQGETIDESDPNSFYYPPTPKRGRANVEGQHVFYASGDNHTPFHELSDDIKVGESIVYYSEWGMKDCPEEVYMRTFFMGIEKGEEEDYASIMAGGLNKQVEEWLQMFDEKPRELVRYCQERYNGLFRIKGKQFHHISSAISHDTFVSALSQGVNIPILTYPAVSKNNRAVNFAIRKDFADKHSYLKQVEKFVVTKIEDEHVGFNTIARGFPKDGKIEWRKFSIEAEPDYENVWICFDDKARPLKAGEGITQCCEKHRISMKEFLEKNKITPETLVQGITEMPAELMEGQNVSIQKREIIASTDGSVFVDSDITDKGRIRHIKVPVKFTVGYK